MCDKFKKQQRKVLILTSQFLSHSEVKDLPFLQQTKFLFLPANFKRRLQLLDLGIMKNFKVNHRTSLIRHFIFDRENKKANLHARHLIVSAWADVTSQNKEFF